MNECKMSLFQNPIAPQRDPQGRILKAATLTPAMEVTPADVYQLITCNEPLRLATLQVRNAALQAELRKIQREEKEYDTLRQNVDALLERPKEQEQQRQRSNDLE